MPQNNSTETVTLKTSSGELVDVVVPSGLSDDQIRALARSKMPEEFAPESFSQQDIQDLINIRRKLAPGDPRADKLDRLLLQTIPQQMQKYPGTFAGAMQAFVAASQPGAYQTRRAGPIQNVKDTSGQEQNDAGFSTIVPKEGEDFQDTVNRTIARARTLPTGKLQQEIQAEGRQNLRKAPLALAAGPTMAAAQLAVPTAAAAFSAPTVTTGTAGTGVLDAAGNEIMREVTRYGPSLGRQALQSTIGWIARHKLLSAAVYEGARRAGVPLPNIISWLSKAANEGK